MPLGTIAPKKREQKQTQTNERDRNKKKISGIFSVCLGTQRREKHAFYLYTYINGVCGHRATAMLAILVRVRLQIIFSVFFFFRRVMFAVCNEAFYVRLFALAATASRIQVSILHALAHAQFTPIANSRASAHGRTNSYSIFHTE